MHASVHFLHSVSNFHVIQLCNTCIKVKRQCSAFCFLLSPSYVMYLILAYMWIEMLQFRKMLIRLGPFYIKVSPFQ